MNPGPCNNTCVISYDGDPCDLYTSKIVKARKQAKCCECREPVRVGDQYERASMMLEGQFLVYRTCPLCVEIRAKYSCDGSWMFESVWEDIREHLFPRMTTGCLDGLSAAAKGKMITQWRKWKGLE